MGLWPFGKKDNAPENTEAPADEALVDDAVQTQEEPQEDAPQVIAHDAISGDKGPFDGDRVDIETFDFSDFATGILNLGSMKIALPKGSQVQVEMGEQGPRMLHIVTTAGRITPVAFAAPTQASQWESASVEIRDSMASEGLEEVGFVEGPWGREIVGSREDRFMRVVGIDGPRWMLRLTLAAPADKAEELAEIGYGIAARTFVYRGDEPMLAGNSLPVALPSQLAEQVHKAMKQREEQARIQKQAEQEQLQRHDEKALDDASQALKNLRGE